MLSWQADSPNVDVGPSTISIVVVKIHAAYVSATRPGRFCQDVPFSGHSVPRHVVILTGTPFIPFFECYAMLDVRNADGNGNVWYFALSQELVFWLKVRQKARICI